LKVSNIKISFSIYNVHNLYIHTDVYNLLPLILQSRYSCFDL